MRIFRLLAAKKQLEQKQIADFAMVPVREAREVLYKMLKGGFLALQVGRPLSAAQMLPASRPHAQNYKIALPTLLDTHLDQHGIVTHHACCCTKNEAEMADALLGHCDLI